MNLDLATYRDKTLGCWTGKNIGGVLGAPFEGKRQRNDVDFYIQDLSMGPPPNDDLDLQIVWLAAVERYGRQVNASILGEYWLSYIIPNWVEYGTGKANLRAGLVPPLSGSVHNPYRESNGCFIRSEIWACLAPGHPDIAVKYAYEDAIVDHGHEGMYGEIFVAALQSAAFVVSDRDTLIDIGLSYIPESCKLAACIAAAREYHKEGIPFDEAYTQMHNIAPGTFGVQGSMTTAQAAAAYPGMAVGEAGFDCPENVGIVILAWLYGGDDFGECMILANRCGEDTDCTCGTLGAIWGIIHGASGLPEKWTAPLNDAIATMCIDKTGGGIWVPSTATELTERFIQVTPGFLGSRWWSVKDGYTIKTDDLSSLYCRNKDYLSGLNPGGKDLTLTGKELAELPEYTIRADFPAFTLAAVQTDPFFSRCEPIKLYLRAENDRRMCQQQWITLRLHLPAVVEADRTEVTLPLNSLVDAKAEAVFTIDPSQFSGSRLEILCEGALAGRHSYGVIKVIYFQQ